MQPEILLLVVFAVLFFLLVIVYNFGDKIRTKFTKKKDAPKKKSKKPKVEISNDKKEEQEVVKTAKPILLSPTPPKVEEEKQSRAIPDEEFDEIKRFIENAPARNTRSGLSDYNKIEEFGDVIDIDDYESNISDYNPYERKARTGESDFIKNRGDDDKKLYDELKNMSPEMKKIIMADILRRKSDN